MTNILTIDTALEIASIALSTDDQCLESRSNTIQNDQAAWLHTAIDELLKKHSISTDELDAVAVTVGPGSYTGLRIGLSTAKGLCYALQKPLLTISSLQLLASVVKADAVELICPMIDARRMEVYYALYDQTLTEIKSPAALVLDENSFISDLNLKKIIFCGNATEKFKKLCHHPNAVFCGLPAGAAEMASIAFKKYVKKDFADLAYCEPLYIKEFQQRK
jgi:tRNA threonylcarbamoyladenosine biosynthesis protein TsaB